MDYNKALELLKAKFALLGERKVVIFCDMDGVLAQWSKGCTPETIFEKDFFFNLFLEPCVREALLLLHEAGFSISILSAAYARGYARGDKTRWLEKHRMGHLPRVFSDVGQNKADFIEVESGVTYVLLDDFTPNLLAWDATEKDGAQFVGIKFMNGVNGGTNVWRGRSISHRCDGPTVANMLADMAVMAALSKA